MAAAVTIPGSLVYPLGQKWVIIIMIMVMVVMVMVIMVMVMMQSCALIHSKVGIMMTMIISLAALIFILGHL